MYGYGNPQMNIDRINGQINELQKLKESYQRQPQMQQPINIYNGLNTPQIDFEARYLNENEKVDEILVQRKTAFIDLKNKELCVKEINGDIVKYEIVLPKDEKDLKIEELERKLNEYELKSNTTSVEKWQPNADAYEPNEPTTKTSGRSIPKQSKQGTSI